MPDSGILSLSAIADRRNEMLELHCQHYRRFTPPARMG
jgi:hypothetical protein